MAGESSEAAVRKLLEFAPERGDCASALILHSLPSRHASPELASDPDDEKVLQKSPDRSRKLMPATTTRSAERSSDSWVDKASASAAPAMSFPPAPGSIKVPPDSCQAKNPSPRPSKRLAAMAAGCQRRGAGETLWRPASRARDRSTTESFGATDRKSTRLNSSHALTSRMPSSA